MKRLIIVGSPRSNGRSAHLAEMLFEANIDERPEDELFLVPVSEIEVGPCIGCDGCRELSEVTLKGEDGKERTEMRPRCVFDDDMQTLYDLLDDADEVTVVSPVYFSGAPAMMKCVLDRMQPYWWANTRDGVKRPAELHVVGEGGDPHGFEALVSEVRSALSCAGFQLERTFDWVGKIDADGEIVDEAREVAYDAAGKKERPKLSLSGEPGVSERQVGAAKKPAGAQGKKGGQRSQGGSAKQGGQRKKGAQGGQGNQGKKPGQQKQGKSRG